MKKIIIVSLLIASISSKAQITLEQTYPKGSIAYDYIRLVKLSTSGYKYAESNDSLLTLYNLNHSVFKTITIPPLQGVLFSSSGTAVRTFCISEELFNTNPADVEYLLFYTDTQYIGHVIIYDEIGNVLLSKDTVTFGNAGNLNEEFISYTSSGCKMILSQSNLSAGHDAFVYSLPGFLPCHDCTNGVITSKLIPNDHQDGSISNYPNPSSGETTIEYQLPNGITTADIVFYNTIGQELKRYHVSNVFHNIMISTRDLEAGTYYYQLETTSGFKASKKMIEIK